VTLFWRSFLLIALLIVTAVLASFQIYRVYEREPRSRELAQQTVSTINLTRAALVNADPFRRRELLIELNESEGLRVVPATASEKLEALPDDELLAKVSQHVKNALGEQTRFAAERDGEDGFWVSFFIDEDEFRVMLPRERFEPELGLGWLGWGGALLALALLGAWLIASRIARPLAGLAEAARRIGRGEAPAPLPEGGERELRTVQSAFNRMAGDLASMERERAMVLAGISHDLRTPLSRLRLALEMSGAEPAAAQGMNADIEEMDQVIGQFLDFARGGAEAREPVEVDALADEVAAHFAKLGKPVRRTGASGATVSAARMALHRALMNLVDNALRHAGGEIEVAASRLDGEVVLEVLDRGPGIPADEVDRLKRPFTRLDAARSGRGGAGLGLAIVERVAHAHGGRFELAPRQGGGLTARVVLPAP